MITSEVSERDQDTNDVIVSRRAASIAVMLANIHSEDGDCIGVAARELLAVLGRDFDKVDIADDAVKNFLDWDKPLSEQPKAMKVLKSLAPMLDKDSAKLLVQDANKMTGAGLVTYARKAAGGDDALASELLKKAGIPGIRYLDQGSRGAGQGSSNFVVFDDEIVKMLGRE